MNLLLKKPTGLILDFGGVFVETTSILGWEEKVADYISSILGAETMPYKRIVGDIFAAETAAKLLRNAMVRPRFAKEFTHQEYVLDFIAADWPREARKVLSAHASSICYQVVYQNQSRKMRCGIRELLIWCQQQKIPVSIASNALCGQLHRDYLFENNLSHLVNAEIYSDEAGYRKPDPRLLEVAAKAINLSVKQCWYVGDHYDRDVLCGKRANVGATVLMTVPGAETRPFKVFVKPDITVANPSELLTILSS